MGRDREVISEALRGENTEIDYLCLHNYHLGLAWQCKPVRIEMRRVERKRRHRVRQGDGEKRGRLNDAFKCLEEVEVEVAVVSSFSAL